MGLFPHTVDGIFSTILETQWALPRGRGIAASLGIWRVSSWKLFPSEATSTWCRASREELGWGRGCEALLSGVYGFNFCFLAPCANCPFLLSHSPLFLISPCYPSFKLLVQKRQTQHYWVAVADDFPGSVNSHPELCNKQSLFSLQLFSWWHRTCHFSHHLFVMEELKHGEVGGGKMLQVWMALLLSCTPYPCVCVCNRKHQTCSTQITFSLWYMQTGMKNTGQTRVQVITLYCQFRWGLTCVPSSSYDEALPIHVRVFGSGATGR